MDWQQEIDAELEKARQARARGNEGLARVCARRAAGRAAREYLDRRGVHPASLSAYDLLNQIKNDPQLAPHLRLIADHLTLRVNENFQLPVDADLIAEAAQFSRELLATVEK
jgi:hypothetical protein